MRPAAGACVEMLLARNFRGGAKGAIAHTLNRVGGERLFGWTLRTVLAGVARTAGR